MSITNVLERLGYTVHDVDVWEHMEFVPCYRSFDASNVPSYVKAVFDAVENYCRMTYEGFKDMRFVYDRCYKNANVYNIFIMSPVEYIVAFDIYFDAARMVAHII